MNDNYTDDMTFPLPSGVTEDALVGCVIDAGFQKISDEDVDALLVKEFNLEADDASLARDRVYGGIVRASTKNASNCPNRQKDPLAWLSYQRCQKEPSIITIVYPEFEIEKPTLFSKIFPKNNFLLPAILFAVVGAILVLLL